MTLNNLISQLPDTQDADLVLSVSNVSKLYPLYADPRDRLKQSLWYALPSFLRGKPRHFYREFWALRNISFEVKKGESIGIVGHNGSGKSTLLQIIAGTLAPTHGHVWVNGRVAALLELGSGFNPEFTGRENIYLNGSILGLPQAEIDRIYDDILAFADIGQFIDQPVKLYSSGMLIRLAFAVHTFVPKQVLIIDEALAVGDAAFQRKCLQTLERFKDAGGTVLLVSHDAQTVIRQCSRCLLLSQGNLLVDGNSKPVTDLYQKILFSEPQQAAETIAVLHQRGLENALTYGQVEQLDLKRENESEGLSSVKNGAAGLEKGVADWFDPNIPPTSEIVYGNGAAEIFDCGMYNMAGEQVNVLVGGRRYYWLYRIRFKEDAYKVHFGMMLKTKEGLDVAGIASDRERVYFDYIPASTVIRVSFTISLNVTPGIYFINAGVFGHVDNIATYLTRRVDLCMIRVLSPDARTPYGIAYLDPHFNYEFESEELPQTARMRYS